MTWREIAQAQGGVVCAAQLTAAGVHAPVTSTMVRRGELRRIGHHVYLAGGAPYTYLARLWAAVLATRGTLGFHTGGRLWGVHDRADDLVHVIIDHERRVTAPRGVRLHRVPVPAGQTTTRSGLPVTSRSCTVLDLLGALSDHGANRLADRAVQRRWITTRDCERRLAEQPGRTGNRRLRRLLDRMGDGAAAESERVLHRLLRRAGITGWLPNHEVWWQGELIGVIDVALPGRRIAIEVDGMAFHVDVDRFGRDRAKQNALVQLGWTVLRFTWADLVERPGYVIATIRRVAA